jgi:hypothetical protein
VPSERDNNPERLSWEILRTRQHMDDTLDELGRKLVEISRTVRKSVVTSLIWFGVGAVAAIGAAITWRVIRHRQDRHFLGRR